jgi:hypothetical protein
MFLASGVKSYITEKEDWQEEPGKQEMKFGEYVYLV